jgi:hypothetical protein
VRFDFNQRDNSASLLSALLAWIQNGTFLGTLDVERNGNFFLPSSTIEMAILSSNIPCFHCLLMLN